ncbi:hypothetical protein ACU4GD_22895 [Cupriavidus basilensis]
MRDVDDAVREVLGAKYDLGLFQDPVPAHRCRSAGPGRTSTRRAACTGRRHAPPRASRWSCLRNRGRTLPLKKTGTIAR